MINRHLGGRITLTLIKNVTVIRSFSYKTKILNFFNLFQQDLILLSQFTNSCLFTLDRLPLLCCYAKTSSSAVQKRHAKRTPPPSIQYLLGLYLNLCFFRPKRKMRQWPTFLLLHRHT